MFTELWAPVLDLYKILKQTTIFHSGDWELHSLVCVVLFLSLLSILKGKNSSHACWWYGYSQQTDCGRSPWTQGAVANCGGHEAALSLGLEWNMVPLCHLSLLLIGECPVGGCGCPQRVLPSEQLLACWLWGIRPLEPSYRLWWDSLWNDTKYIMFSDLLVKLKSNRDIIAFYWY